MLKMFLVMAMVFVTFSNGHTCSIDGKEGFLPKNDLWIPTTIKSGSNINESQFHAIIDKVIKIYEPVINAQNAELVVERKWKNGTVNAFANQKGNVWSIAMYGGLARHEAITQDGFAMVVCHELGHHLGGAPKYVDWFGRTDWASNEGQSDYFATLKCLRKVFRNEDNVKAVKRLRVPATVYNTCRKQFSDKTDRLICQRSAMAGMSGAKLFQDLRQQKKAPNFKTPDLKKVTQTSHSHPAPQCRLDTYYAGAICNIDDSIDVDNLDETAGVCSRSAGDRVGVRPLCWFAPKKNKILF